MAFPLPSRNPSDPIRKETCLRNTLYEQTFYARPFPGTGIRVRVGIFINFLSFEMIVYQEMDVYIRNLGEPMTLELSTWG